MHPLLQRQIKRFIGEFELDRAQAEVELADEIRCPSRSVFAGPPGLQEFDGPLAVLRGQVALAPHLVDLDGVVEGHAHLPLHLLADGRAGRGGDQLLAPFAGPFGPLAGVELALHADAGRRRPGSDAEPQFRDGAFLFAQVVGNGRRPLEPGLDGGLLLVPVAPGDVVGGAEVGVQQDLLGRHADRRMGVALQLGGRLDGQGVVLDRPLEVGLGPRAVQVAHQALGPGLDVLALAAGGDGPLRLGDGLREPRQLAEDLGPGNAVLGVLGGQTDRLVGRGEGLGRVARLGQQLRLEPMGPGVLRREFQGLVQVAEADVGLALQVRLRPQHERLGMQPAPGRSAPP